jgi:uncharacterized protein YqeY
MLSQRVDEDLKAAMKAKDVTKLDTLRMLKAALGNFLIEKKKDKADDNELIALIQKQIKLRQDSIESFKKAGRQDLLAKETAELKILEGYLPAQLSDAELENLVKKVIQQTGAKTKADLGRVMKEALAQSQGRADGKRVSQLAGALLTG